MQTLTVIVQGNNGKRQYVRAVCDGGCQKSYIEESLSVDLELTTVGELTLQHQVFGAKKTGTQKHRKVKISVTDMLGNDNCVFEIATTPAIAYDVMTPPPGPWMKQFQGAGINFTDNFNDTSTPIRLLLGNDVIGNVYTGRIHRLGYGPIAMETRWGWVLSGKYPVQKSSTSTSSMLVTDLLSVQGRPLSELWKLEAIGITDPAGKEDKYELAKQTRQHFDNTVLQLEDGRYQVCLPWLHGAKEKLPSNYCVAARRLRATSKDLQAKGYLQKYDELFCKWETMGMIEEVPSSELNNIGHYLPHRAVIKLSSATTPIRPVFDASSKGKGKLSLNECLDKGPNLLEMIPHILLRLRLKKIVVLADIEKEFQQISIILRDRDFLRFLWWEDKNMNKMKVYRHSRVPFGATCSPYLLLATLRHHIGKAKSEEAASAALLLLSLYVDNTVLSVDSMEDAVKFQKDAVSLLLPAKFNLRDWEFGPCDEDKIVPVLGLLWNKKEDTLALDISKASEKINVKPTLRHVLSLVHSIFDPLGFVCPFTLVGKLLLRRCHEEKLGLDSPLPSPLEADVFKWAAQIPQLADFRLPRHVHFGEKATYSLHVMCDASSAATAVVIYLRREEGKEIKVYLLCAKSRVAPKKKATIPRLELIACVIGSRLAYSTLSDMGNPPVPVYFWSDSSTALAWIRGTGPWGVFVSNCVEKIKKTSDVNCWRHVPGKCNAADLPSRGCSAQKLIESRWIIGPDWLLLPADCWPNCENVPDPELVDLERRKTVTATLVTTASHPLTKFLRISTYPRILKAISAWLLFKEKLKINVRGPENNEENETVVTLTTTAQRIQNAERVLILFLQEELHQQPERINKLNAFIDENGFLRTRTRLTNRDDEDFTCPIILPDKNEFVERMIWWEHELHCHVGVTTLLGILRAKFWITNGRRMVRGVLTKCWICRRFSSRRSTVPEGPLPSSRTNLGVPFFVIGLDAAGPLILKDGGKIWILLFTCATYRAVHLELIDTLSADGFVAALRRFVSRRGRPSIIYSDNACGFVATQKSFSRVDWKKVEEYAAVSRIEWRFNPPCSPWWGGWWERLIGLTKQLIRRVLGKRLVDRGELETLVCEVEDSLNNRPLTHQSENPDEPIPLTPNHFVRHCGGVLLPEADLRDAGAIRSTYKKLQHLREALRSRFRLEYLGLLRGAHHQKNYAELKPGAVVLIERDNFKRQDWPLGVIIEALPGRDGVKRLFRVKTRTGETLRPAQRLFLMEQAN